MPSHNIGRLASIASPGSYWESYSYDSLGRPTQQAITADSTSYTVFWDRTSTDA